MSSPEPDVDVSHSRTLSQAELTPYSQSGSEVSPPPSPPPSPLLDDHHDVDQLHQSGSLTFPVLESDGSLPSLRDLSPSPRRFCTPPAALSSLAAKMAAARDLESSIESLETNYDMVEDASEISTEDSRETASLASTDHLSDEESELTPEEDNVIEDEGHHDEGDFRPVEDLAGTLQLPQEDIEANRIIDSYLTDDMETPRQSLLRPLEPSEKPASPHAIPSPRTNVESHKVNLNIVLYSQAEGVEAVKAVSTRIATSIGAQGVPDCVKLPTKPDDREGTYLFRYENLDIIVTRAETPIGHEGVYAAQHRYDTDLAVVFAPRGSSFANTSWDTNLVKAECKAPVLVITSSAKSTAMAVESRTADMVIHELIFRRLGHRETTLKLRQLLDGTMTAKGWNLWPVSSIKPPSDGFAKPVARFNTDCDLLRLSIGALCFILLTSFFAVFTPPTMMKVSSTGQDRALLADSLTVWTNRTDLNFTETTHALLPDDRSPAARTVMVVWPNQLAISTLELSSRNSYTDSDVKVTRMPDQQIEFTFTKLATGIYGVTIPSKDAYGNVSVSIPVRVPAIPCADVPSVDFSHDFGVLAKPQRGPYEKAGMDLAKAINKDIAVARKAAKSLTDMMSVDLSASAAATQNVTTQLAVRMTRDLQLFASAALEAVGDMTAKSETVVKDARKDVIKGIEDIKKSMATTARNIKDLIVPSKETLASPLAVSRQRALLLKDVVAGKKPEAEKEADARFKRIVNPFARMSQMVHDVEKPHEAAERARRIAKKKMEEVLEEGAATQDDAPQRFWGAA